MSLDKFEAHLRDPAPGFRCYAAGNKSKDTTLLARVGHQIGPPAASAAGDTVKTISIPAKSSLIRFVELHDGLLLYRDKKSDAAGIRFFPAAEWESRTAEMRESMEAMGIDTSDMPDWFHCGTVFAEIPESANYFVIDNGGKVFYADHDDFGDEFIASSFDQFLDMIVDDPPGFLYRRGCYTRYSDGSTATQWVPKEYVANCDDA
jgi:hypothetical protein